MRNNAGGFVFQVSDEIRVRRFLIMGTAGGTYYVTEQKLTIDNLDALVEIIEKGGYSRKLANPPPPPFLPTLSRLSRVTKRISEALVECQYERVWYREGVISLLCAGSKVGGPQVVFLLISNQEFIVHQSD